MQPQKILRQKSDDESATAPIHLTACGLFEKEFLAATENHQRDELKRAIFFSQWKTSTKTNIPFEALNS